MQGLYATAPVKKGTMLWEYCDASVKEYDEQGFAAKLSTLAPDAVAVLCTLATARRIHPHPNTTLNSSSTLFHPLQHGTL